MKVNKKVSKSFREKEAVLACWEANKGETIENIASQCDIPPYRVAYILAIALKKDNDSDPHNVVRAIVLESLFLVGFLAALYGLVFVIFNYLVP